MMTRKQKLYFLLDIIDDIRTVAPSGHPLVIDPVNDLNQKYRPIELVQLFTKLENDDQVMKIIKAPSRTKMIDIVEDLDPYEYADDGCWHIELLPTFDTYFLKIQAESEYQEFTGRKPKKETVADDTTPSKSSAYDRKALEKIWNVLQEIEEKRQIGTDGNPVRIPCYLGYGPDTDETFEARKTILAKLESLGALTGLHKGVTGAYYYWSFEIGNNYSNTLKEYKKRYEESAHAYQQSTQLAVAIIKDPVYEIKYSEKGRQILINNFLIAKPEFAGENEMVFSYLYEHPNEKIKVEDLENHIGSKLTKPLHKIIENLGFSGDIRSAFFDVSKQHVRLRNPVTKKDLEELGIAFLKLK